MHFGYNGKIDGVSLYLLDMYYRSLHDIILSIS